MVNCLHGLTLKQAYHKVLSLAHCPTVVSDGLTTNARLFADDVLLFSVVDHINLSATNLNSDFSKINAWASQWRMTFNPDPNKQAQDGKSVYYVNYKVTYLELH